MRFKNQHITVSVPVHHNVSFPTSNSTHFFVIEDPELLVDSFVDALLLLSEQNLAFQTKKLEDIVEQLKLWLITKKLTWMKILRRPKNVKST